MILVGDDLQLCRMDIRIRAVLHNRKRLVNRGFLNEPVCLIYGVGTVLTTALEYIASFLMEKGCKT